MSEDLVDGLYRCAGDVLIFQFLGPRGGGIRCDDIRNGGAESFSVYHSVSICRVPRILFPFGFAEHFGQLPEQIVVACSNHDLSIGCLERFVGGDGKGSGA